MFLYPLMYRTGMLDALTDTGVAVYTGSTLHEVAHVAGRATQWIRPIRWESLGRPPLPR